MSTILNKNCYSQKYHFYEFRGKCSAIYLKKFWILDFYSGFEQKNFGWCSPKKFQVPRGTLWAFFLKNYKTLEFYSDFEQNDLGLSANNFRQDCQNCVLRVQNEEHFGYFFETWSCSRGFVKNVYILREWFSFRNTMRRKKIISRNYLAHFNAQFCSVGQSSQLLRIAKMESKMYRH